MLISAERLQNVSSSTGFRPEILEKVIHLIHILNHFAEDPYLKNRFVLKGGTALNLFYFNYPRLSVDIDINYIGSIERNIMRQEREQVESAIEKIIFNEKYTFKSKPSDHAGGKWFIRYNSDDGFPLKLKIEINSREHFSILGFLDQPFVSHSSWASGSTVIRTFYIEELMGTKLRALYQRRKGRDLYDLYLALTTLEKLDPSKIVHCFHEYMKFGGHPISKKLFIKNMEEKLKNTAYEKISHLLINICLAFIQNVDTTLE